MYIDVTAGKNTGQNFSMMYRHVSPPREVFCIKYQANGEETPVQVKGWDAQTNSPCAAYACRIEESGDGTALLVYGGSGGIRMKSLDDEREWSLSASDQWGETHLVYPSDCFIVYTDEI